MDDIVPGLLDQMKSDFQKQYDGNSKIQELNEKLNTGTATYHEANEYASEVGKITKKTYEKNISSEMLPDGKMYYNIADRVIGSTEHDQYELVSEYTEQVQTDLNKKAGIGLKAQVPEEDIDRVEGLVNYASNADSYDDIAEGLIQGLESMALETVNKSVEKNADFQYKSGLQPKIVRNGGDCCEWCSQLLGRYDYPNLPDDVYRRHNNCTCTVEYDPGDGKRLQNVWNHNQWREATDEETLQNRKIVGLDDSDKLSEIEYRKHINSSREKTTWKRLFFNSPEDDVKWLDAVGGLGTDENITAQDWYYIRENINQKISKSNIGKIVTLHSFSYVYVIEIISFSEYNVLYKIPNDDNLNDALAARRKRKKMIISETVIKLMDMLIDLDISDDFIKAIVSAAANDNNRQIIIDYITTKKNRNEKIDDNQLVRIAVYLGRNNN